VRRNADGGVRGSGVVHDALFVFESIIIMDDDTAAMPRQDLALQLAGA
jgi:hypothetical protein